ncbi:MAG: dienelactone hydrolase [Bradyrhizobium sp.]|jgi:putative phosphoribosyl transferase|nr:dienelactone hydrolase [Bradyrhizobium sp.]
MAQACRRKRWPGHRTKPDTALAQMRSEKQLVIVPGATHLFEEPRALDEVARLARDWFYLHLNA